MSDARPKDELSKGEAKELIDMIAEVEREEDDAMEASREKAKSEKSE